MPSPNNPSPTAFAVGDLVRVARHPSLRDPASYNGISLGEIYRVKSIVQNTHDYSYSIEIENDPIPGYWSPQRFELVVNVTKLEKIIYNIP